MAEKCRGAGLTGRGDIRYNRSMRVSDLKKLLHEDLTPQLLDAVNEGDAAAIRRLLAKRANPNATFSYADVMRKEVGEEGLQECLSMIPEEMRSAYLMRVTPLIIAVANRKKVAIVRLLLDAGADPNFPNQDGTTPLMLSRSLAVTRLLLERGAKLNAHDDNGLTALMFSPNANITRYLLSLGAEVNAADKDGVTALMLSPDADCTEALLKAGADPNVRSKMGATAVMYAADMNELKLLEDAGADLTVVDCEGRTPLHYAAMENHYRVIPFWAERLGANVKDAQGNTPMDEAAEFGSELARRTLLRLGGITSLGEKILQTGDLASLFGARSYDEENA